MCSSRSTGTQGVLDSIASHAQPSACAHQIFGYRYVWWGLHLLSRSCAGAGLQ